MIKIRRASIMALILTLLLTTLAQAATWQFICKGERGIRWYADTETIHVKAPHVGVMQKIVLNDGSYVIALFAADYRQRTFVIAKSTTYAPNGQVVGQDPGCSQERHINPNSPADMTLNYIMGIKCLY